MSILSHLPVVKMGSLFLVFSSIEYEGSECHGVFTSKEKAKEAIKHLKKLKYDASSFYVSNVEVNHCFVVDAEDVFPSKDFS